MDNVPSPPPGNDRTIPSAVSLSPSYPPSYTTSVVVPSPSYFPRSPMRKDPKDNKDENDNDSSSRISSPTSISTSVPMNPSDTPSTVSAPSSSPAVVPVVLPFQAYLFRLLSFVGMVLILIGFILYVTKEKGGESITDFMLMLFGFFIFAGFWCCYTHTRRKTITNTAFLPTDDDTPTTTTITVINNPQFRTLRMDNPPSQPIHHRIPHYPVYGNI